MILQGHGRAVLTAMWNYDRLVSAPLPARAEVKVRSQRGTAALYRVTAPRGTGAGRRGIGANAGRGSYADGEPRGRRPSGAGRRREQAQFIRHTARRGSSGAELSLFHSVTLFNSLTLALVTPCSATPSLHTLTPVLPPIFHVLIFT